MIGYLQPLAPGPEEEALFRSYQCGLCATLEADYGFHYRLFAKPDLVFYNLFLDLLGEGMAPMGTTPCPLSLGLQRRPARNRTENTRLAAAFGVYMTVEKLRDDWEDEGSWAKGLAWKALATGHARARTILEEAGFPLQEVERWMAAQATVEAAPTSTVTEALEPTRQIAALSFGFAGRSSPARQATAAAIGAELGSFLFWMDNLLDAPSDARKGRYNALLRSQAAEAEAMAAAHSNVDALRTLLPGLANDSAQTFLEKTLLSGFADKLHRFASLTPAARNTADLPAILPPPMPILERVRWVLTPVPAQFRFAVSLAVLAFFPTNAWAQKITASTLPILLTDTSWDRMLNTCFCSHCCVNFCSSQDCGSSCTPTCGSGCQTGCGSCGG